jgi:RNA polymerase sigma-70 factor (ECF subfamily)
MTADADLIRRMADEDDLDAFATLFEKYRVPVYRAALALTGDHGVSEEVVMDTFGRAYTHRRRLRTDISPLPWLHKVALNLCYSRLGRRRLPSEPVTDLLAERLPDANAGPAANAEWAELRVIVREGIVGLSGKHQAVVVLYYLEGRSLQETADALGLPLGTVKSRLHHALRDLRGRLAADRRFGGAWGDADAAGASVIRDAAEAEP